METKENNNTASTHQEKARKLKKLRRWQIVVSLLGIAINIWGIIQVVCLFLNYKRTETSNDAQIEQYISPVNLRASGYIKKICFTNTKKYTKEIPYLYWTTGNIKSESWKLKLHSRMHKPVPQSLVPHYKPRKLQPLSTTPP